MAVSSSSGSPWLAVVIPTRDGGNRVHVAIESVLRQGDSGIEVIVVDDASQVPVTLSEHEATLGVRLFRTSGIGVSAARNLGIEASDAAWVAFLDDDDRLLQNWSDVVLGLITHDVGLVSAAALFVDEQGFEMQVVEPRTLPIGNDEPSCLFLAGAFCVRRDVIGRAGGYDSLLSFSENTELGFRLLDAIQSLGLSVRSSSEAIVCIERRLARRRRATPADLYRAAVLLLERHELRPNLSKDVRADYHAVAGVNAAKIGSHEASRSHLRASLRLRPFRVMSWLRLAISLSRRLSNRAWPQGDSVGGGSAA